MNTYREAMASAAAAAVLASVGISSADAEHPRHADFEVDRELALSVSDGFARQTWRQAGQVWTETRETLSMHEEERVRVYIINDMPGARVISFGEGQPVQRVRPGETVAVDLTIGGPDGFTISVVGQPALSRPVRIRSTMGKRLNTIA
jgi:hypothetical protein